MLRFLAAWFIISLLLFALYAAAPRVVDLAIGVLTVLVAVLLFPFVLIGGLVRLRRR